MTESKAEQEALTQRIEVETQLALKKLAYELIYSLR